MIFAAGCAGASGTQHETDSTATPADSTEAIRMAQGEAFLQLFPQIQPNDIEVASPKYDSNGVMLGMVGKWIDSNYLKTLPAELNISEYATPDNPHGGYHAIGRFTQGDHEMLLVRGPGEYASTRIFLWAWHKPSGQVRDHIMVADNWGDAGDAQDTYSWLHTGEKELEVRMAVLESHLDIEDTTGREESFNDYAIFLFRNGAFDTSGMKQRRNEAFFRSKLKDKYLEPDSVYVEYHPNSNSESHE